MADRVHLDDLALAPGKEARLARMLYTYGPGNGTLFVLPYDHGMEHGPIDVSRNPESADPAQLFELAIDGDVSAIATPYGIAARYFPDYAGEIPLIVKVSGKTDIPPDGEARSALDASVEDAVRIGADGIGCTLDVGSPSQDRDLPQLRRVRQACDRFGMPLIVWADPRGRDVEAQGGRHSLFRVEYAARLTMEMGADVVNVPKPREPDTEDPDAYAEPESLDEATKLERVVGAAQRTLVIGSGGSDQTDEEFLANVQMGMEAGANGLIAGRDIWQRPRDEALAMTERIHDILDAYGE